MRVTSKGQVTIPIALREKAKIFPDTEVEFGLLENGEITIRKAEPKNGRLNRGEKIIARLKGSGTANLELTTDQIMALTRGWGEDDLDR